MLASDDRIGQERFYNGALLTSSVVLLLIARGGYVSTKTRQILSVALAGALVAVISDQIVRPNVKV